MNTLNLIVKRKGGVGGTYVARLLVDYLGAAQNRLRVFDAEAPGGSLKRFYADAEIVDFRETGGQMRVLDGLSDTPTIVDLPAGSMNETMLLLRDAGFLDDAARGKLHLSLVHVLAPNVDSLGEAAEVAAWLDGGGVDHFLVQNCANEKKFDAGGFLRAHVERLALIGAKGIATVDHLDGDAVGAVDGAGETFTAFAADQKNSDLLRRKVLKWQHDAFASFDKAGFRAMAVG